MNGRMTDMLTPVEEGLDAIERLKHCFAAMRAYRPRAVEEGLDAIERLKLNFSFGVPSQSAML